VASLPRVLLDLELAAARATGALSRLARRGGGTTLPGKLLWKVDPGAIDRLAARLPRGAVLVSATNGKTTTAAMAAAILRPETKLVHNAAGANLVSGVASALIAAPDAELGLFEVDEGALPEVARRVRPRVVALGNLFRDQLDRYGELELIAERWRTALADLPDALVVANADDPLIGESVRGRPTDRLLTYGLDDPAQARTVLQHAADSKYCPEDGTPYRYAASYVGHLGDYRCETCGRKRLRLDVAARDVTPHGLDGVDFTLALPAGSERIRLGLPGLYNVYNATAAAALATALGVPPARIAAGLESFDAAFGRFERIRVDDRSLLLLLVKNPAGANEVVRTLVEAAPPSTIVVALNDELADGRDVSWIWDVDFEPLLETLEHAIVTGGRADELALRFAYGGLDRSRIEVLASPEAALDRGLELTPPGEELVVLPTYTAMLALRGLVARRGLVAAYWETS